MMKETINKIDLYKHDNGRLPPKPIGTAEAFSLFGYQPLANGSYEVHHISFDGPAIKYSQTSNRWQCNF